MLLVIMTICSHFPKNVPTENELKATPFRDLVHAIKSNVHVLVSNCGCSIISRERSATCSRPTLHRNSCLWGFCKIWKVRWQNVHITIDLQIFQKHNISAMENRFDLFDFINMKSNCVTWSTIQDIKKLKLSLLREWNCFSTKHDDNLSQLSFDVYKANTGDDITFRTRDANEENFPYSERRLFLLLQHKAWQTLLTAKDGRRSCISKVLSVSHCDAEFTQSHCKKKTRCNTRNKSGSGE